MHGKKVSRVPGDGLGSIRNIQHGKPLDVLAEFSQAWGSEILFGVISWLVTFFAVVWITAMPISERELDFSTSF